ncbi:MAG: HEAT repeat domain-containing protein, partial [Planctomycetota bacterium]
MKRAICLLLLGSCAAVAAGGESAALDRAGPLARRWEPLHDLLARLAERDGIRWAMPETLAGRVIVGGNAVSARAALDEACKQAKLSWMQANGIVVVHRADDAALDKWTGALKSGGSRAVTAAWELGWLRDARAIRPLARALAGKDTAAALAAAQAIEVLCKSIPLGRTDRVSPPLPGRVELAAAFPPETDLGKLLGSPYPAIRAAATTKAGTASDQSFLVEQVRQQMFFEMPESKARKGGNVTIPPPPGDEAALKAACDKMYSELSPLGRRSSWGQMQRRAQTVASWANSGSDYAFDTLVKFINFRQGNCEWFGPYAQKCMATVGGKRGEIYLRELLPKRGTNRAGVARLMEKWVYGEGFLSYIKPYLGNQTVCYVAAWKAGRESHDDLLASAEKGNYAAVDALAAVGGPKSVEVLGRQLAKDEPGSGTLVFRSAKALGRIGGIRAQGLLLAATADRDRLRRHAAVLYLGRIGGPEAVKRLIEVLEKDKDRMVRAAAADALEQIGAAPGLAAAKAFRKADAELPPLVYRPRNPRLGAQFPVNEWVDLKIKIIAHANYGEMGWNYDAANKLFFRYGGCSGYTNELTAFDLGTGRFAQRRPNEETAGWDQRRPARGCSAGRTWDPYLKCAWIGPAIGGSGEDLAIYEYYNRHGGYRFCSYDFATDRFRPAHYRCPGGDDQTTRYAYDWKNGLMMPVRFNVYKQWYTFNTRAADPYGPAAWTTRTNKAGPYPTGGATYTYTNAAVHQKSGLLVVHVPPRTDRRTKQAHGPETWTYDPTRNAWKNMQPKEQPGGREGGGMVYDPFSKVMPLHGGRKVKQYGGAADSITWSYDPVANVWKDLKP